MKKKLVILGHPSVESYSSALADNYICGAQDSGDDVRRINIGKLEFDHILWHGYAQEQPIEPDIKKAQEDINWADHLVFVYPIWWASPPALLKSFIERTLLPGYAFKYKKSRYFVAWDRFLNNKTARIICTMDAPPLYYKWIVGDPGFKMMRNILNFCGIKPVRQTYFGSVKKSSEKTRKSWLEKSYKLGQND